MTLHIVFDDGRAIEWRVGEFLNITTPMVRRIEYVAADGDELIQVEAYFANLPKAYGTHRTVRWWGDHAKFIVSNLSLGSEKVEESQPDGHPLQVKISNALILANQYNQIDGSHHKDWLLDQVVRALTGCEFIIKHDAAGPYIDERDPGRPSEEYTAWIKAFNETHGGEPWYPGMAP